MKKLILIAAFAVALAGCRKHETLPSGKFTYDTTTEDLYWAGYMGWQNAPAENILAIWINSIVIGSLAEFYDSNSEIVISLPISLVGQTIDLTQNGTSEERTAGWELTLEPTQATAVTFKETDITTPLDSPIRSGTLRVDANVDEINNIRLSGMNIKVNLQLTTISGTPYGYYEATFSKKCFNMRPWLAPGTLEAPARSIINESELCKEVMARFHK